MQKKILTILSQIESIVIGKPHECRLALACLLAQGHLLIEDLPGMGKTTLAQTLAKTLQLSYQRTQFTSDLLPSDVVGISIFNQVVLADEINRASPKTQSALLEAMAENQVSIDGYTHILPRPFFVIATQNPLFHAGTYPLPESQLDRFMMRISLGFPDIEAEKNILLSSTFSKSGQPAHSSAISDIVSVETLTSMQDAIQQVHASTTIIEYIIALCRVSRGQHSTEKEQAIVCKPLSPRAGKALLAAARAWAFIENRDYLLPDDIKAVFYSVCEHRLEGNITEHQQLSESISQRILDAVNVLNPLNT